MHQEYGKTNKWNLLIILLLYIFWLFENLIRYHQRWRVSKGAVETLTGWKVISAHQAAYGTNFIQRKTVQETLSCAERPPEITRSLSLSLSHFSFTPLYAFATHIIYINISLTFPFTQRIRATWLCGGSVGYFSKWFAHRMNICPFSWHLYSRRKKDEIIYSYFVCMNEKILFWQGNF